jgi:RimJ/RimL family protein N-acetyltransferase/phosphopantetheinyl transferase
MLNYPFKYLEESISISINPTAQGEAIMDQFSTADSTKFSELKTPAKKQEFLWSRSALLHAGAHLKSISYLGKKPIIASAFISLSHCKGGVVAAYSKNLEVGIDIETRRENLGRIATKFTTDQEKRHFTCDEQATLQFIWGIKESLFKLYGFGNIDFKKHLEITSFEWNAQTKQGWGTAWITQTCAERTKPTQCLVQTAMVGDHFICLASHRKPIAPFNSERITLREWIPEDAPWLYELNKNTAVVRYTGDAGFTSEESALKLIKTYPNYQRDGYGRWMAIDISTDQPIGWCGLKNNPWGIDLGFRFFEHSWGKGIATECAFKTIEKAKELKLPRLIGRALSENIASWKVLEKVGMLRYHSVPIEEFAEDFNLAEKDLESWKGQMLHLYKLDLK